jgi:Mg2+-importing ATPase
VLLEKSLGVLADGVAEGRRIFANTMRYVLIGTSSNFGNIGFIRRFMVFFGPISSVYDFATFGVMLGVFHAHASLFRSGWFVESLATQALAVFVIRTRRVPFLRSRPSRPLLLVTLAAVAVAPALPYSPLAHALGFRPLPALFLGILAAMAATYLMLAEAGKAYFYRRSARLPA